MLIENLILLCRRGDRYKIKFESFIEQKELSEDERERVKELLCEFLVDPESTKDIAECFPQLLLILLSLVIHIDHVNISNSVNADCIHRLNCVILGKLICIHPDVLGFVLRYFELNPAPFEAIHSVTSPKRCKIDTVSIAKVSEYDIVIACYNILRVATNHFKHKWNWSKFYKYLTSEEDEIKWVALKCIAIVLDMSESLRLACAKSLISDFDKFLSEYKDEHANTILCASENVAREVDGIVKNSTSVVSIAGILLPVLTAINKTSHFNLVLVPSTEENLRSLALAVASRKCICLQGPVGCGKTALVEYLAKITGHGPSNFTKIQLGDQTDSKMLLGTYRCTDIPGEFVWQPGALTQAVMAGKWLLLEDIDSAALDVASVLSNLIETGTLSVPGYRDTIYVKSEFQLFVTQRLISSISGLHKQTSSASNLLQKNWFCVNIEPLSRDELVTIIQVLFPPLNTVATRMVDVFLLFSMGNYIIDSSASKSLALKTGRLTSTRDLIKWCSRAIVDFEVSSPDSALKIFQDAIDTFCCSVANQEQRLSLATAIGHTLGIVKTKAEYFCHTHKPSINFSPEFFVAGRAKVPCKKSNVVHLERVKVNFSFTRPSVCLLERIASCVVQREPILLVGETGTGKTSSVQYLAQSTGHKLVVINMNQQSESADLLGGYKPVDLKFLITPIREEFEILFRSEFAIEPNREFLRYVALHYKQSKWKSLVELMSYSTRAAVTKLNRKITERRDNDVSKLGTKRRNSITSDEEKLKYKSGKINVDSNLELLRKWERLALKLDKLASQVKTQFSLAFAFIEGSLIKALQEGHWVLLDEINLANAETLECLSGLLEGSSGSLSLLERGDKESIKRHPDFTIFACMNPATDVGKKELPVGLRNRFTEFFVDELTERSDLQLLVGSYLEQLNLPTVRREAIVKFYLNVRKEAMNSLSDGTAHKPHYSLRTLCRALSVAASNPCGSVLRTLYEAFCLSFLTQLDHNSYSVVERMIARAILDDKIAKAILSSPIPKPKCGLDKEYINFEGYWVIRGSMTPETPENYILTNSVRRNLKDLVRVVAVGKMPVLLQGDTSVGKTSLIMYLAKASGHVCVRINNHEHTDLQEYVGSYVADQTGKLVFKEGVLVEAMRKGHWIILDELNLAPSDVLEALNRVLDDNRELFIPETQQVVKAHPHFMLFATQNPPGLYGGRKVLSRAFRNRFVELHFDEIPANELQIILHKRCNMPDSYCKQIINVMTDLQIRRKSTAAFAGKQGFITLRDLFRWGERYRLAPDVGNKLYDWSQHLADEGYLVLSAKVRKPEEANEIREVIKKHLKRDVDPDTLFTLNDDTSPVTKYILDEILNKPIQSFDHIVWTYHMRRIAVLIRKSCQFKEPVLLVGETGGGKTTICQLIATMSNRKLYSVNCHMHTESSDFLGNLRPVRDHSDVENQKLFEWVDGPLIKAMQNGDLFLADEISLADDSVLERLNSLLEPERTLLLAEKGIDLVNANKSDGVIVANENFFFIGTMNPGGDYGKKELSPALRNRFTEIWCEGCMKRSDLQAIINHNLDANLQTDRTIISVCMLDFVDWLTASEVGKRFTVSIRDILTWVNFINVCTNRDNKASKLNVEDAYYHGACLTYTDSLGCGSTGMESSDKLKEFRNSSFKFLKSQIETVFHAQLTDERSMENNMVTAKRSNELFGIAPFFISKGSTVRREDETFTFTTPTTGSNTLKLLRGLQLNKPLLLEGSPGVGKTSLVSALAKASGNDLLRINLSDQTDVSDLFGADLPVEGGKSGEFAWKDGPFLRALRAGHWILLDELNLASQSVLEGLNACLDHRGEVYIPELSKTFVVEPGTKLFACQNPLSQGGARRGLPKSFLNRFTQVFIDALAESDLKFIVAAQFQELPSDLISTMVAFNSKLASEVGVIWGYSGSPWEMNLRDITRWCEAIITVAHQQSSERDVSYNPGNSVELIYGDRMRTVEDKRKVREIYQEMFSIDKYPLPPRQPTVYVSEDKLYLGDVALSRTNTSVYSEHNSLLLRDQMATLRSLAQCVKMNWMSILVGDSGCGKSSVVRVLAQLVGRKLKSIVVNSSMDTTEILGGFEQTDYNRHLEQLLERVENLLNDNLKLIINEESLRQVAAYHCLLEKVRNLSHDENDFVTMSAETELFLRKVQELSNLVAAMKTLDPSHALELQQIGNKLERLAVFVERDKCLNAGGKFEWVDSVLVKCLQEGSWLLVDQVNLCSSAVLDRLNGLLEPSGVLSINERGVDNDGNIVTVKPHEDFRIFLTMDSHHGEISRAMRNRGVEIYMLGRKEDTSYDLVDLKSMMLKSGLARRNHQDALLDVHRKISEDDLTIERRLGVNQLLHCAVLVSQRISRGLSAKQAFKLACTNVYLKARSVNHPATKDRLMTLIDDTISRFDVTDDVKSCFDLDAATLSILNLQDNSKLTIIRQQGFLLTAAVEMHTSVLKCRASEYDNYKLTTDFLNEFFDISRDNERILIVNVTDILPYLLLNFYELSSQDDAKLRNRWLSKVLVDTSTAEQLNDRSTALANEIVNFSFRSIENALPWGLAQLPGAIVSVPKSDNVFNDANRLALLLYLRAVNINDGTMLDELTVAKNETISVMQYSNAIYHDKLVSHLTNQPLVTNFVMFIAQLDKCIDAVLRDSSMIVGTKEYVELRRNLKWRNRFYNLGELTLINKLEKSKNMYKSVEDITLLLRVHYKWLVKFLRNLFEVCQEFELDKRSRSAIEALAAMIIDIDDNLQSIHDPFRKIAKKIKQFLKLPLPFSSDITMNVYSTLKKISSTLLTWRDRYVNSRLKQELKIVSLQSKESLEMRCKVIMFWRDIYLLKSFDETTLQALSEIERFCNLNHPSLNTSVEVMEMMTKAQSIRENEMIVMSAKVQLWPIYEYIFLMLTSAFQKEICQNVATTNRVNDVTSATSLFPKFAEVPSIPTNLIAISSAILTKIANPEETNRLLTELFVWFVRFSQYSCAIKAPERILHWTGVTEENVESFVIAVNDVEVDYPICGPVLVNLVSELILTKTAKDRARSVLATATLGTFRVRINQLKILNDTLWSNSIALNSERYDYISNDLGTLKSYLNTYLSAVKRMEAENDARTVTLDKTEMQIVDKVTDVEARLERNYLRPLEKLREVAAKLDGMKKSEDSVLERGKAWALLGYLQVFLFGNLGYIDPVHKVGLKLRYIEEDIVDCKNTIYVAALQSLIFKGDANSSDAHPRILEINRCLRNLLRERDDLKSYKAVRPLSSEFVALAKETTNFRTTLGSYEMVQKHVDQLVRAVERVNERLTASNLRTAESTIQETEMWQESLQRFSEQMEEKFLSGYPDLVLPVLTAVAQLKHGTRILVDEMRKSISIGTTSFGSTTVESLMYNLVRFPTIGPSQDNLLQLVDLCTSQSTRELINKNLRAENTFVSLREQFKMMKCGLHELHNYIMLNGQLSKLLWTELNELLQQIVLIWRQQQKEEEKREAEKESLYKNKARTKGNSLTEDEEISLEIRNLFPSYRENDFFDIERDSELSLERKVTSLETKDDYNGLITEDDIKEVQEIHSSIVVSFTSSEWLNNCANSSNKPDYVEPLIQRYDIFGLLLKNVTSGLHANLTSKLYASLNFLTAVTLSVSQGSRIDSDANVGVVAKKQKKTYDFYRDSNVEEVKQCLPLLECCVDRVDELLERWPEHPSLKSIQTIIKRIYAFPVTSSVSRFLTGLELLLVKMQEWEENAHVGVSLSEYSQSLTQQIISWRKLELACWKDCLNVTFERLKLRTSKWWFFLYALIECYVTKSSSQINGHDEMDCHADSEEPITLKKLIESLELFINGSSLVEYGFRLNLLLTFHCHVYYLNPSRERDELLAVLWNIYKYYDQFTSEVNGKIGSLKAPIEKKLKDFIKIARWNDISYWAVKETVERTHRTLHKFIKEYESGLKESVVSCLVVKPSSRIETDDRSKRRDDSINPTDFIVPKSIETGKIDETCRQSNVISRAVSLLVKAKKLCKETILMSSYPGLRISLEQLLEETMDGSLRLKDLEVDRSLPKPKQKSHAKSILQQKKMALANYFKILTRLGVSYRVGVLAWKNKREDIVDLTVPPLNLSAAMKNLKIRKADEHMLAHWEDCEKYYYKSFVKLNALNKALMTNQTDLGLQNMERCGGFSSHIMLMAHKQKRSLAESFSCFVSLRLQLSNLFQMNEHSMNIPNQRDLQHCAEYLKRLLITLEIGLEQLELYLQACPYSFNSETSNEVFSLDTCEIPIIRAKRGDAVWETANSLIKKCLNSLRTIAKRFDTIFSSIEVTFKANDTYCRQASIITPFHFKVLIESYDGLEKVGATIREFSNIFNATNERTHPIVDSINFLEMQIKDGIKELKSLDITSESDGVQLATHDLKANSVIANYETNLEHLLNTALLAIERKYKENMALNEELWRDNEIENNDARNEEDELEENKLKEKLIESLDKDIRELKLNQVLQWLNNILTTIQRVDAESALYCNKLLARCLPLLQQYILFCQFYLNEQVASFRITCKLLYLQLNVFLDLATNGFCVPKDLDLEDSESSESLESSDKGGMGLGDGEGRKDVSDRIESEDQLDEARPAGQEKEDPIDNDCKEENNGIDMSEDFDGKLQDIEKNESDEEQTGDDKDEELDKQMGETEKDADQLDEEIWGADEAESEDESKETEEEKGKGEQIGEKEIGTKDDTHEGKDDDEVKSPEKEGKEINEMDEPDANDDQIDPYHGRHEPEPEPEPLDLPEDMNLDEDDAREDNPTEEENPFDIDTMKECKSPPEKTEETKEGDNEEDKKENDPIEDSSDEECCDDRQGPDVNEDERKTEDDVPDSAKQQGAGETVEKDDEENFKEDENKEREEEKAEPSTNDASEQMDTAEQVDDTKHGSRDRVAGQPETKILQDSIEENDQDDSNTKGNGQAQSEQQDAGHSGSSVQERSVVPMANQQSEPKETEKRKNPGRSDERRSLIDKVEPDRKKLKIIHSMDEITGNNDEENVQEMDDNDTEMCQHIKNSEKYDECAMDAATKEQVKEQASNNSNNIEEEDERKDVDMHEDEEDLKDEIGENSEEQCSEKVSKQNKKKDKAGSTERGINVEDGQVETKVEIEGTIVETMKVNRGDESTFHTNFIDLEDDIALTSNQIERKRLEVETMLSQWTHVPPTAEARIAWNCLGAVTDAPARDLSEKLRLVLEPTQASRLKGDYRTGRRINMRKIIPYIASEFRKDKIWLRRTKPSKRDYQVVLALDDSSSMADNQSKELAFESLSLISKAMTYLEVGQLCVISFGEQTKVLHRLGEPFTEESGSRLMQEMRFEQKKTMVGHLVDFTVDMFDNQCNSLDNAKLLVVLSDGRGIFSEGMEQVNRAVRRARLADIFLVFIIVDNPVNKDSILDIRMPVFQAGKLLDIKSYMDSFPFPFYMILRDINALPGVLSDALRQWFEVVGKIDI